MSALESKKKIEREKHRGGLNKDSFVSFSSQININNYLVTIKYKDYILIYVFIFKKYNKCKSAAAK